MKLYEFPPTRSIRVRWTLQELEVPFESATVDLPAGEHRSPAFLAVNPAGKLPVLVDGDVVLSESGAIVLYLAEKFPEKRLLPTDVPGRAQAYRWLLFVATELEQPLWRITRHTRLYPEGRRLPGEIALARDDFRAMAAVLDEHMRDRPYVLGDGVSVVDFFTAYTLDWADMLHLLEDYPGLRLYIERMYDRPHAAPRIAAAFASLEARGLT